MAKAINHLSASGEVRMVDVGQKAVTARRAVAEARVRMSPTALEVLRSGKTPKGDLLATVRIAAIQAAKRTAELIPLCHALPLDEVRVTLDVGDSEVSLRAEATAHARTGVEMEALTAASIGALTLYDMMKAVDRGISFQVSLLEKEGGDSGPYRRGDPP